MYGQPGTAVRPLMIAVATDTRQVYTHYLWVLLVPEDTAQATTKNVLLPWLLFIPGMLVSAREKALAILSLRRCLVNAWIDFPGHRAPPRSQLAFLRLFYRQILTLPGEICST